jgi:hypothetical protein
LYKKAEAHLTIKYFVSESIRCFDNFFRNKTNSIFTIVIF